MDKVYSTVINVFSVKTKLDVARIQLKCGHSFVAIKPIQVRRLCPYCSNPDNKSITQRNFTWNDYG